MMNSELLQKIQRSALAAALVPLASIVSAQTNGPGVPAARIDARVSTVEPGYKFEFMVINSSPTQSGKASPYQLISWELPLFSDKDIANVTVPKGWAYEVVAVDTKGVSYNAPENPMGLLRWDYNPAIDPLLDAAKGGVQTLYGPTPQVFVKPKFVLHFFTVLDDARNPVDPVKSFAPRGGFSFTSAYAGTPAPYRTFWEGQKSRGGDRPLKARIVQVPNSPSLQQAAGDVEK